MKRDADEILKAALALPSEARAALARALLESIVSDTSEDAEARRRFERARDHALKRLREGVDLQWVPDETSYTVGRTVRLGAIS